MTQEEALACMRTGKNCFLTGKAGTGKTYAMRKYIEELEGKGKTVIITAPTGIAAINAGGATVHSTFKMFGTYPELMPVRRQTVDWDEVDLIVIDEISMVGPDYVDQINYILQECTGNAEPFGGIQMLFVGDPEQLPPVYTARDATEKASYERLIKKYGTLTFDKAKAYDGFLVLELTEIRRTKDEKMIALLNRVRDGDMGAMTEFNGGYGKKGAVHLKPYNAMVDKHNAKEFGKIKAPAKRYVANVAGKFNVKNVLTPEILELKEGARVMVTRNLACGLVNGDLGYVESMHQKSVVFKSDRLDQEFELGPSTFEETEYQGHEQVTVGTFTQIPLKLSWAITIHKAQGLTLDNVCMSSVSGMDKRLAYVGLSRCTTFEGLSVNHVG